ncbi:MAG: carboxypeptidase regulatory-like domain-containing protein [Thermoplasmata archaeon]|nr:carboxypeptidase regulatory-like domain-containing protein [Thermoplasmata archaeon]
MANSRAIVIMTSVLLVISLFSAAQNVAAWESIDDGSISERIEDSDGDGKINSLIIDVPIVGITWLGYSTLYLRDYLEIAAELWNSDMTEYVSHTSVEYDIEEWTILESATIPVSFSGRDISASGVEGPYLAMIVLTHFVVWRDFPVIPVQAEQVDWAAYTITGDYSLYDFEIPEPYEMLDSSYETIDDDGDGLWDWIRAHMTIDVLDTELVTVQLELEPEFGSDASIIYGEEHVLTVGDSQTLSVDIDGRLINGFNLNEKKYAIRASISTTDGFDAHDWIMTDFFDATDFEDYPVSLEGAVGCEMLDVNDDGLTDFFRISYNITVDTTSKYRILTSLQDPSDYLVVSPETFDGYLMEEYEETIVEIIDAYSIYETGLDGPLDVDILEIPLAHSKWPGYTEITGITLGNGTTEDFDHDELNHPALLSISGFVKDQYGEAIPSADMMVSSSNDTWYWSEVYVSWTDVNGEYTALGLVPGQVTIQVVAEGYLPQEMEIDNVEEDISGVNFTLEEDGPRDSTISGTTLDREWNPLADVAVILFMKDTVQRSALLYGMTVSNALGEYSFEVKEGDYFIEAAMIDSTDPMTLDYTVLLGAGTVTVAESEVAHLNVTLNMTADIDSDIYSCDVDHIDLSFEDWEKGAMTISCAFPELSSFMQFELLVADLAMGDDDGLVDEDEIEGWDLNLQMMAMMDLGMPLTAAQSGLYFLESFCVDGIGYSTPSAEELECTGPDLTGSVWDLREDLQITLSFDDMQSYWDVPEEDTHRMYIEVDYAENDGSPPTTIDIGPPSGFVLLSSNGPDNVSVEGTSHVTIIPGESPDSENLTSVLVMLELTSATTEETGSIWGTATLQDELDHSGVLVDLLNANLGVISSVTTYSTGEYVFPNLEPGDYHVRASMTGYIDSYGSVTVSEGVSSDLNIVLLPVGTAVDDSGIQGRIVTESGASISDATVNLYNPSDSETSMMTAISESDGMMEFEELQSGEYRLEVSADGFHNETLYIVLNAGETKDIGDIALISSIPVGYITGAVEDAEGDPVTEVTVEARLAGSDAVMAENETKSDGSFVISGLEDGEYNLTFIFDGDIVAYADVVVEDSVGDAGVIVIDISQGDAESEDDRDSPWVWILLIAIALAAVAAFVGLKMRKPKAPQPMELERQDAPTEEGPPLP